MRLAYYAGASTAAAAACLLKAFHQRPNFYSATVYLSQSNACLLILTNLLLVMACSFMFALQRLLYGPLRPIEIEQLSEKAWYAVLDTLLAMPSFREEVGGWLLTMFVLLLAGKVWGWIGEGRVDVLEQQPPANPRLFHTRLATSLILSVVFDIWMLNYCVETVVADPRPGMMVIFTFEFAILCVFSLFTLARYSLSLVEAGIVKQQTKQAIEARIVEIKAERAAERQNTTADGTPTPASPPNDEPIEVDENEVDVPGWEEKRRYLFGLEVLTDFIKLVIYIVFFTVSITFNGLPMHIMRDVYMTFASFSKRVNDYLAYRKATSDMNSRYPDATTEEIRGDACIVCRESMIAWEQPNAGGEAQPANEQANAAPAAPRRRDEGLRAKKLPCGHILHLRCLKAWLERQQVCPTCRRPVITATPRAGEAPLAPGQPPAGHQGQRQAPRPRARMFNFGPLRVGLLNAPNGQMQDILNRIQNPEGQNQNGANQQGPGQLHIPAPHAVNGQQGTVSTRATTGLRASVPVNVQLMQIEQRIMQEAHNLGIEQQQLYNLRIMEAELARLRAQHIPAQQAIGTGGSARPLPPATAPLMFPSNFAGPPPMDQLQGSTSQQLSSGHTNLPEGLVLPEGWTLMPLHRVGAPQPDAPIPQAAGPSSETVSSAPAPVNALQETGAVNQAVASASSEPTRIVPEGPADDRGSPLFVPTQQPQPPPTDSTPVAQAPPTVGAANPASDPSASSGEAKAPWGGDSWNFVDTPTKSSGEPLAENSQQPESSGVSPSAGGKGKARAVEVEEVPDADAGT